MSEADPLLNLQAAAAARLEGDPWFTPAAPAKPVKVVTERLGDLDSQIEAAVSTLGVCASVMTPSGQLSDGNIPALDFDRVDLVVQVSETPIINQGPSGAQKSALEVVVRVMRLLHHFVPPGRRGTAKENRLELRTDKPFELIASEEGTTIYQVHFRARARIALLPP